MRRGCDVPIRPFLTNQIFEPELIREMSLALENSCEALGLRPKDDAITRLVASKIIEFAQCGVHDNDALQEATVNELKGRVDRFL